MISHGRSLGSETRMIEPTKGVSRKSPRLSTDTPRTNKHTGRKNSRNRCLSRSLLLCSISLKSLSLFIGPPFFGWPKKITSVFTQKITAEKQERNRDSRAPKRNEKFFRNFSRCHEINKRRIKARKKIVVKQAAPRVAKFLDERAQPNGIQCEYNGNCGSGNSVNHAARISFSKETQKKTRGRNHP